MITKCERSDKNRVISYIGANYPACLYLYLDLLQYGIGSNAVDVFIQGTDDRIDAVLLQYYSCLHVYSASNSFDSHELALFFSNNKYSMLYSAAETSKRIFAALPQKLKKQSTITTGWVSQIKNVDCQPQGMAVKAQKEDFEQIVQLIYGDEDIGRSYKYDELETQIEERNREGYARNIVIKRDNVVIAHACTNAEINGVAVVAELLVRKEYRRKGFATEIWRELCSQLLAEGKEVFSFYYTDESRALHKRIGFEEICQWAKIVVC